MDERPSPRPFQIVVGTGIAFGLIGFALALRGGGNPAAAALLLGLLGLVLSGVLVNAWHESRPFILERQVPIDAADLRAHAGQWFGQAPWRLAWAEPRRLAWWRRTTPALGVVVVLLIFGIVPGILYHLWARHDQTMTIEIEPASAGSEVRIEVAPRLNDGRNRVVDFYNSLQSLVPEAGVSRSAALRR